MVLSRPYSIINEKSLLYIVSREKLLIVLNRIETLTNIYSIKRDMYSFCVNLYKYVNSTGIADGLFDWLLKCCYTTTLAWKTTLSQRKDGEEQSFEIESKTSEVEGVTRISKMGKNNVFLSEKESELSGKPGETKKRANVRQRSEEPSCY